MSNTNYTKFSNPKPEIIPEENLEPVVENDPIDFLEGIVDHCKLLNVRAEPDLDAEVLRKISVNTKVMIDPIESTNDFYKVYLSDGVEGFCMKKFIEIE